MKTRSSAILLSFAMALGASRLAFPQTNPPQASALASPPAPTGTATVPTQTTGGKKPITFSAKSVQGVLAKDKQDTILTGSVKIITGSLVITADRVELSGQDYVNVACSGNVNVTDTEKGFTLVSQKLSYQRDTEIGVAQGKVAVDDTKNHTSINAEWVRFDQRKSIFEAAVSVVVLKEDMSIRAEYAYYNRDTEEIKLHGGAVAVTQDGTLKGDTISAGTDWSNLQVSGEVSGTITPKGNAPSQ